MSGSYRIKKGFDIRLAGKAGKVLKGEVASVLYGVKPTDFPGLIPGLGIKIGDSVKAGTVLFFDKKRPEIRFCSPVSGTVKEINRGEQRKILDVVIERGGNLFEDFGRADVTRLGREEIINKLLQSGLWPAIRQRPYHVIADPSRKPKSIFISGFDTAPLAPDLNFIMDNSSTHLFYTGLKALGKLTEGKVHLGLSGNEQPSEVLKNAPSVEISYFSGPHPAGNVGVHIHHIDPLNKGEVIWFVNLQDVITIGCLFEEGIYRPERVVALAGPAVTEPAYFKVLSGISIKSVTENKVEDGDLRYISGNVLTGANAGPDGYLGFYDSLITVLPEGRYHEFFGWALPGLNKFSFSRTFLSSLFRKKEYRLNTNIHGGKRAFVMTGLYEKVLPMDILPMQLLKAILAEDIDAMENLGIYEVAEEDFALCEFVCPSKIEIQSIIRQGIDLMIKEMS